ncbi:MAG: GNAT family N-acetyltransferase [Proteobacteria bacterium]|nr:GNAT family N-acetyltransferase [Pseudomonadota bacterium]MDA1057947.1 GNAT family N-acetyltransferase [Pseudomonadota bacterium]
MNDADTLLWRVEAACRRGWPTPHETVWQGWLFRHGDGERRRVNSVNPLNTARAEANATIAAAEAFYRQRGADTLFCVPSMANDLDASLAARGYVAIARTTTLTAPLGAANAGHIDGDVELAGTATDDWAAAHRVLAGTSADDLPAFRETLGAIADPVAYAALRSEGRIAAQAYGVIHDGLLVIEAVATAPGHRRGGLAHRVVGTLLAWARDQGARAACLQVLSDNLPAQALYRRLGFDRELYNYHYRAPPGSRWGVGT